jgi:two-component system OmpR family sensor kinase
MSTSAYSLRFRLLLILALAIFLSTLIQAGIAYRIALNEVDTISDYHMVQMAHAVRRGLPPPPFVLNHPARANNDNRGFLLQVTQLTPEDVALQPTLDLTHGFTVRKVADQTFRVFTLCTQTTRIEVLHDMKIRSTNARHLALRTVFPILIIAPLLLLCVWWGISRALRPLIASRNEIARKAPNDLKPLHTDHVPDELLPFVAEINSLFLRISQAFATQQSFVSYAAHELRSPLTALRLQVQGLQRASSDEARKIATERVIGGIDRATRLIEQMLVLAREESTDREEALTHLAMVARLAISDVFPLAHSRHIDLGAEVPEGKADSPFEVAGNVDAMRTLLRNLLENAVKYAPLHGVVNLTLKQDADARITLSVEDNGPGIPAKDHEMVFERFRRGDHQGAEGCGLGLSIVKAIATRHHIELKLDRSATLGGLSVTLHFPAPALNRESV